MTPIARNALIVVALAAVAGVAVVSFAGNPQAEETAVGPVGACGQSRYAEYRAISQDLSLIAAGQSRDFADPAARATLLDRIAAETFEPGQTYVLAGHGETQELFVQQCTDRMCTMEEMAAPEQSCLRTHLGNCSYVAMVDDTEIYCLLGD